MGVQGSDHSTESEYSAQLKYAEYFEFVNIHGDEASSQDGHKITEKSERLHIMESNRV